MSELPEKLIESLKHLEGFDEQRFRDIHRSDDRVTSIRVNPQKKTVLQFAGMEQIPWCDSGFYLPSRPSFTLDPAFHAGAYYVQEASSMFLGQCLRQHVPLSQPLRVLDLCAAPGGKSTLMQSMLTDTSLLVSNEVIKTRVSVLVENITKWGYPNTIVTNSDPRDFQRLENYFDVIVVDAPCSGSGLFRRDANAIGEWSPEAVAMCSLRQQRILADAYPALKSGGLLIYSTCSYSQAENEEIADWLVRDLDMILLPVHTMPEWKIIETRGYRFFPDRLKGEGFYIAALRKGNIQKADAGSNTKRPRTERLSPLRKHDNIDRWLEEPYRYAFYQLDKDILIFPEALQADLAVVQSSLYVKKAGIVAGRLAGNELIPAHELALSTIVNKQIPAISFNKEDALQYLRKEEVKIATDLKGWALAKYEGLNLGWMKMLNNRVNNYYPREWRILKSGNN